MNKLFSFLALITSFVFLKCTKPEEAPPVVVNPPNTTSTVVITQPDPEPTNDKELFDKVQKSTFNYFWVFGHPESGMARERSTSFNTLTTGGSGFGVMALVVGVNRNWITRKEASDRIVKILNFLEKADRYHGVWSHWYTPEGKTIAFSQKDNGGDLVETSFIAAGLLTAREFFNGNDDSEKAIRERITKLWEAIEWNWHVKDGLLYWHWSPNFDFQMNFRIRGWNEAMITYVLAMASPKFPITFKTYDDTWTSGTFIRNETYYNYKIPLGPIEGGPLFFSHYSFLGLDPRQMEDRYANYWTQNLAHTMINRAYCLEKAPKDQLYGEKLWGLTSSDEPSGYSDHHPARDNGTVAPTAALSAFAYTPYYSFQVMKGLYEEKSRTFGDYGFFDALNKKQNWYSNQYISIDQGPIVVMMENYRSELIWKLFMGISEIKTALSKMGITTPKYKTGFYLALPEAKSKNYDMLKHPDLNGYPIDIFMEQADPKATLELLDSNGTRVQTIAFDGKMGASKVVFNTNAGVYVLSLKTNGNEFKLNVQLR